MTDIRRLSVEMREQWTSMLSELPDHSISAREEFTLDALHDLDVADRELAAAQAAIEQQGAVIAELRR